MSAPAHRAPSTNPAPPPPPADSRQEGWGLVRVILALDVTGMALVVWWLVGGRG